MSDDGEKTTQADASARLVSTLLDGFTGRNEPATVEQVAAVYAALVRLVDCQVLILQATQNQRPQAMITATKAANMAMDAVLAGIGKLDWKGGSDGET